MNVLKKLTILIYFFSFVVWNLKGQTLSFKTYNSNSGLSQNSIYSITQDKEGFLWFGSQAGLNRFDGNEFKLFVPRIVTNHKVMTDFSKMITALHRDATNFLWVGTTNELLIYDAVKNKWYTPEEKYPGFYIAPLAWVVAVTEDAGGKLWVSTRKAGLYCYDKIKKKMIVLPKQIVQAKPEIKHCRFDNDHICTARDNVIYLLNDTSVQLINTDKLLQSNGNIVTAVESVNGDVWFIANGKSIYSYNLGSSKLTRHTLNFDNKQYLKDLSSLYFSDDNTLWISSRTSGLVRYNIITSEADYAKAGNEENALKKNFILSIFQSEDGLIWVGTSGGGVSKCEVNKAGFQLYHVENKGSPEESYDNMILSAYTDDETEFYMGTSYAGLLKYNIRTKQFHYFAPFTSSNNVPQSNNIYSVIKGDKTLLWLATWGGLYSFDKLTHRFKGYFDKKNEFTRELNCAIKLKLSNKILICSSKGIPLLFDTDKKIFEKCKDTGQYLRNNIIRVRYAEEKENGDVYLATENNGLVRYNYINGRFTEFPSIRRISGVCRHFILDQGKIWAGTEDGLVYLDPVTGKVLQHLTTENGLSDNVIYGVLMDDSKQLWVSTNKGICKIDQKLSKVTIYSMEDGLQDLEFNTAVAYKFTNGNLLFGGINGFNIIKPVELKKINFVPTPLLVDLKVLNIPYSDSVPYPFLKNISLKFNQNFITMGFQSPVFTQINRINYRYMLSNLHETWINNGSRNYVNFIQLKPGNYTFKVQAFDDNKVYSGINEIYITIHAPWYYNFWFLFFSSMAIVTSSLLIISARIKALKVRKSLLHQKAVAEMQSLRLQMNPHFIFNSLNSINSYIVDNKTLQASDYLSKFSRLMRLILENSRHETITLSKELEYVSLYLLIESLRFAKAFEYEIHVDESVDAENLIVPPLFIQPFLENSIWHGLMPRKGTRTLNLDLTQSSDILTVVVSDNGVGREYSAKLKETKITLKNSHGMDITKNRIMYHNPKNTVQIEDLYNALGEAAGTRVVISIHYI